MTDFPELQHALVDAARTRYGRAPRTRRALRLVPIAAACAVIAAAAVLVVLNRPAERENAAPPRPSSSDAIERSFAVFRRPARAGDALPLSGERLERFRSNRGGAHLDTTRTRLGIEEGSRRLYLVAAEMEGRPAVCASLFRGDVEVSWTCGPLGGNGVVASVIPARFGEPSTILGAAADGVKDIRALVDGATFGSEPRDNAVFFRVDGYPSKVWWTDPNGREQSFAVPAPAREDRPAGGCPTLEPLPANAERAARRVALETARGQFIDAPVRFAGIKANHATVAGCGPVVADRTLSVSVSVSGVASAVFLVGQIDGELVVWHQNEP